MASQSQEKFKYICHGCFSHGRKKALILNADKFKQKSVLCLLHHAVERDVHEQEERKLSWVSKSQNKAEFQEFHAGTLLRRDIKFMSNKNTVKTFIRIFQTTNQCQEI